MLALLSQRALSGTDNTVHLTPEEEDIVNEAFDVLYENLPIRMSVEEHTSLGLSGLSYFGLAHAHSMYTDFVENSKGGVVVLVSGTVKSNYSGMDDVEYVLNEYMDCMDDGKVSGIWTVDTESLCDNILGDFVALIYDRAGDRLIILSGDGENNRSLYWGWHRDYAGSIMIFSDDETLLESLCQPGEVHVFPSNHISVVSTDIFELLPVSRKESEHTKKKKKWILKKVESANNLCIRHA
jgi:hypothetical protein